MSGGPAWLGADEAAARVGMRDAKAFRTYMRNHGFLHPRGDGPSERALATGAARAGDVPGSWLWAEDLLAALSGTRKGRRTLSADSPERAEALFRGGVERLLASRADWSGDAHGLSARDPGYALACKLAFSTRLGDVCRAHGPAVALASVEPDYRTMLAELDPGHPDVAAGMAHVAEAFAMLRRFGPGHPLVRYGLVPEPGPFPPEQEYRAGGEGGAGDLRRIARLAGFPEPVRAQEGAAKDMFAAWEGGKPLAVIHRNGMTWHNALVAVLASGTFGAGTDEENEARAAAATRFWVPAGESFATPVIRAPRRAAGTAPVNDFTRGRYEGLLQGLGRTQEAHPLPGTDREARALVEALSREYAARRDSGGLPATPKQVAYAVSLAERLGEEYPFGESPGRDEIGDYIAAAKTRIQAVPRAP